MSDFESQIQEALRQNGSLDPERREQLGTQAHEHFGASMRRAERMVHLWLALLTAIFIVGCTLLGGGASTRTQIVGAVLVLVAGQCGLMAKLWYWAVNGKILLLKEIYLLRLGAASAPPTTEMLLSRGRHLSKKEQACWGWGSLVFILGGAMVFMTLFGDWLDPPDTYYRREMISVDADGSGSTVAHATYRYRGEEPVLGFDFSAGGEAQPDPDSPRWYDAEGRRLPVDVSQQGDEVRWDIHLVEPVEPGGWVYYRQESDARAGREGDLWIVSGQYTFGFKRSRFTEEITLPPGAIVESASPEAIETRERGRRPVVVIEAEKGALETFQFEVKYRMAESSGEVSGK